MNAMQATPQLSELLLLVLNLVCFTFLFGNAATLRTPKLC
jgi:hypothetical protein